MKGVATCVLACSFFLGAQALAKGPWALIDGDGAGNTDSNQYDVVVIAVDGNGDFDAPMTKRIETGFHYVQMGSTRPNGVIRNDYRPYAFVAEPCVRYVMHAQYENTSDRSPWELVVQKSDRPIAGCKLPPGSAAAPGAADNTGGQH